jgi:hypothetical protein
VNPKYAARAGKVFDQIFGYRWNHEFSAFQHHYCGILRAGHHSRVPLFDSRLELMPLISDQDREIAFRAGQFAFSDLSPS